MVMSAYAMELMTNYDRNKAWAKKGGFYSTDLKPGEEAAFREWVHKNGIPFDYNEKLQDYDMRGFWKALQSGDPKAKSAIDPNDKKLHYPDFWKTPYHKTFSSESQWAEKGAPSWNDKDQLVGTDGKVMFDDKAKPDVAPPPKP